VELARVRVASACATSSTSAACAQASERASQGAAANRATGQGPQCNNHVNAAPPMEMMMWSKATVLGYPTVAPKTLGMCFAAAHRPSPSARP
jgi:hypothetical protein